MFDLLDGVLLIAVVLFGVSGYRQGFVIGALSFIGFLGGAVLGAKLAPTIAGLFGQGDKSPLLGIVVVFLGACLGQLAAAGIAASIRQRIRWHSAQTADAVAGAVVSGISVLLVAWLVASAVNRSPFETLRRQVRNSAIIVSVDSLVPGLVRDWFDNFLRLVEEQGFPQVFAGLAGENIVPVQPPDPALANSAAVRTAQPSVLKIRGNASCGKQVEGSGFVFAPQHIMTNAHVVAGVSSPRVELGNSSLAARVVVFDPDRDVAVLYVPDLQRPALRFAQQGAPDGAGAIVMGYPEDGPFSARSARVRNRLSARGSDIYSQKDVTRDIYGVRSIVRPGNSGGPLLTTDGSVYGVVFAAASDDPETGYALTAAEVTKDAQAGRAATQRVSTQDCD
ncbi:MAG TPA: MarP family serine protease [Frankiaceae bacterium]|nr:MarP family serine protease [Frankiaceae bacterium]